MKNKKIISDKTIKNIYKKDHRGDIIGYSVISVVTILSVVLGIIFSESTIQTLAICLYPLLTIALLISVVRTRKSKKASYVTETNHNITEAYLVHWESVPGSGEGTWYNYYRFWCGEKYGILEATSCNNSQEISAQIFGISVRDKLLGSSKFLSKMNGRKFYVFLNYSLLKSRYEVSLAFLADKYALDDQLSKRLTAVSESGYEEVKNRLNKNTASK